LATPTTEPTLIAADVYSKLAARVNMAWTALGSLPSSDSPLATRQKFQAEWFLIEDEIVEALARTSRPATLKAETGSLATEATNLRTMLQRNDTAGQYLELIAFTARQQTAAASALRSSLGLPLPGEDDLI
jgi:hypothetical protein